MGKHLLEAFRGTGCPPTQVLTNLGSSCCLLDSKELEFSMELVDRGLKNRKEQVITLCENINLVELRLIQPYEHVITNCICEIKLQSLEMENLAIAVKRAQDQAAVQLSELEEEMGQRIQAAEHKTRKEENQKVKKALSEAQTQPFFRVS
ncbi:ras and EF-hand domain-containing protein-like isoform X2 [Choloepus didactylus]|uniref:ras and EF-hand domain-containing protein-like isoform X2 n=1 Tax=Choloepus didactylus TaxID=27675 RepID=UPI00189DC07C|nr:ras and EF-hand domain-containing protein-like isoform X2 [Choloepus didactylus]XP_037688001.1 ras and EF-hand domain-containing protein-like isoform X2 [Choloepus didactylus]